MKIVLIGYMGSGKSSVGKLFAQRLNYAFKDLDVQIEQEEGVTVSKLFADKGEIYFRKKESEILKQLLSSSKNLVLATGGGTPCYGNSLQYMLNKDDVVTVYLKNSLQALSERLFVAKSQRPLIAHLNTKAEVVDFVRKHLFERSYYYSQASAIIEADDGMSMNEVVEKIILKLF